MPKDGLLGGFPKSGHLIVHADTIRDEVVGMGAVVVKVTGQDVGDNAEAGEEEKGEEQQQPHVPQIEEKQDDP